MKQGTLVQAFKALNSIYRQRLPLPISFKVRKLREELKPAMDFQIDEENKIISEMGLDVDFTGRIIFPNDEAARTYNQKAKEIADLDSDVEFHPIELPLLEDLRISGADVETLEGFVTFKE